MIDLDHLTPGPWHPLTVSGDTATRMQSWAHPDGCPARCRLGRILNSHQADEFPTATANLSAGRYRLRWTARGIDVQHADGTDVPGQRPTPPEPVKLTDAQAEALAEAANEARAAYHHLDQCGCDQWPASCASGYEPVQWETGAWYSAVPALLAAWERMRVAEVQQPEAETVSVSPASVLLSSRCDACQHTLNWHRNDVGCTVALCVCGRFQLLADELRHTASDASAPQAEPIVARWDRTVVHPEKSTDDDTLVCCLTDTGQPVALLLDDEYREALGLLLIDPNGEMDQPTTIYRAAHEGSGIVLGHYTDPDAARAHCGAKVWQTITADQTEVQLRWHPETPDEDSPEGLFLTVHGEETDTGYTVTPIAVDDEYDPDADE